MKKTIILGSVLTSFALVAGACSDSSDGVESSEDLFVTIAAGGTSGVYYPIAGAMANVYGDAGHDVSVQATGASVENVNLLQSDQAELAIVMADTVEQAYEGFGAFEGEDPQDNLVAIAGLYPNVVQVITTTDSGIESFEDLEGKRVAVGDANSGVELNARMIFEAHDMTYDDISADYLPYGEAIDQMRNGMLDAAFVTSGVPNSAAMDLASTHDVTVVPIDDDAMNYLNDTYPFFIEDEVPAGTYDNEEDISTPSITNLLVPNPSLSDDEVYELTSLFYDNLETIQSSHEAATDIEIEHFQEGVNIPLHPGAERYFQEQGLLDE